MNVLFQDYHSTATSDEWENVKAQNLQERGGLAEEVERLRASCVKEDVSIIGKL